MTEIPYSYQRSRTAASLHEEFDDKIETGTHTEVEVSVAGRIMLRRGQGKLAFATLADSSGRIQLFAPADKTANFEGFTQLNLGDWIGAKGTMMKTRKGELSIEVSEWTMLAVSKRQFPDKWHGLQDTDTRYRQRYVDLWVTEQARATLTARSRVVTLMRNWLQERGFLEVETPILQTIASGGLAKPFVTHHDALDIDMYMRIAPELFLKRLLVGGFEKIFEIGRNFRNEGMSPRHNPEFTMLELYEMYGDYNTGMQLVEQMVAYLATEICGTTKITHQGREIDLTPPWPRRSLTELVSAAIGEEISITTPIEELRAVAEKNLQHVDASWTAGTILFELYEGKVESTLWDPVFVMDLPKEASPLSRDHRSAAGLVEHADAVVAGRELAPIYSELIDADEQRSRFEEQARQRAAGNADAMPADDDFLRALEYGMPPTSGLGLGIDRLAMLLTDSANIRDVLFFPTMRPERENMRPEQL